MTEARDRDEVYDSLRWAWLKARRLWEGCPDAAHLRLIRAIGGALDQAEFLVLKEERVDGELGGVSTLGSDQLPGAGPR